MKKPRKPKKQTTFKEDTAKILLDLGKLIFSGVFIGGILRGNWPHDMLITGGIAAATVLILSGVILGITEKKRLPTVPEKNTAIRKRRKRVCKRRSL